MAQNIPARTRLTDSSPYEARRRKLQEHIYEVVDDEDALSGTTADVGRLPSASQRVASNRGVPVFDPRANWERRSLGPSSVTSENAKLFASLSAVFSGSPRGRHLALLREGCFRSPSRAAYSGVPSSTDSERSSSSLMVDRSSSSPSTDSRDVTDCPAGFRDSQRRTVQVDAEEDTSGAVDYPRSMPNLQAPPELVSFSNVLKYPSADSNISLKVA